MVKFSINGESRELDIDVTTPLLWVIRDYLELTGTKFGCGIGMCRACTVLSNGSAIPSCVTPVGAVEGREITTIEGLNEDPVTQRVQAAWLENDVSQCGYCQPGFVTAITAELKRDAKATAESIKRGVPNICRCGTYTRMSAAIEKLVRGDDTA